MTCDPLAPGGEVTMTTNALTQTQTLAEVESVLRNGDARQISDALDHLRSHLDAVSDTRPMFIAPWLSARARQALADKGVSYADATGNVQLLAERPGMFVAGAGAHRNPWPTDKSLQSLRGKGAMRALRVLVDFAPPSRVRELAGRTNASAATLSRVIDLLVREGLAVRDDKGVVTDVDWAGAIRRWTQDYDVLRTNDGESFIQPRGLAALTDALRTTKLRYALTGSLAAQAFAPVAPAKLAMVYVDDFSNSADEFDLRPTDAGANVILLQPYDDIVFERLLVRNGLKLVNPSQLAADLLTGPGRSPSEGQELLAWMREHTDVWRA